MRFVSIHIERYGDVQRLRMGGIGGRVAGIDVSAYVVRGVMIDTGFHHVRHALIRAATALDVRGVVVTHWHEDHAGNVASLARRGLPILLSRETERTLRSHPRIQLYRRVIWGDPPRLKSTIEPFDPPGFDAVHTPGHSADHHVVWDRETGTLFSGDLWLGVRARVFHASEDPFSIVESLRRAAALAPDRMFDAHRGFVKCPTVALHARADWLSSTIDTIGARVADGWSDPEIVKRVLGGEERAALISRGDYARANLVKAVRRRVER
jgi:glyoxylase-like metal-dependent hydrolase (beta-lactamase superfamily II)